MNIDDLRDELATLAGPVPRASAAARAAVGARVARARRRRNLMAGGSSMLAAALVVAIVAAGLSGSNGSVKVETTAPSTTTVASDSRCALGVRTVPASEVPSVVAAWADGAAVVGGHALWTARASIASGPIHDGSIYRLKIGWYAIPFGLPTITARRLDGPGRATGDANEAINEHGKWVASAIELPAAGCWEITARYRGSRIVFSRLVGHVPLVTGPTVAPALGTLTGRLEMVGGPAPGSAQPVNGYVDTIGPAGEREWVAADDGTYRAQLPAGRYAITGRSGHYENGLGGCSGGTVVVIVGRTSHADVVCPVD
jgi:hypothetical protein